jgi:hypothetical protein
VLLQIWKCPTKLGRLWTFNFRSSSRWNSPALKSRGFSLLACLGLSLTYCGHEGQAAKDETVPLYREFNRSPLAYLRLPLPWQREELSSLQAERLSEKILVSVLPGAGRNLVCRSLLRNAKGPLELTIWPPENPYLPIPAFALKVEGPSLELMPVMEALVLETMSEIQGSPANWVKFKDSESGPQIRQAFILGGHVFIVKTSLGVTLYFSSNIEFLKQLDGKGQELEKGKGTAWNDAFVFLDPQLAMKHYQGWLKRAKIDFPFESLTSGEGWSLGPLSLYTKGKGADFSIQGEGIWASGTPFYLEKAKNHSPLVKLPMESSFGGFVNLPQLSKSEVQALLNKLQMPFFNALQMDAFTELLSLLGERMSFSWSETLPSPLIRLEVRQAKDFERALTTLMGPNVRVSMDPEGVYRHCLWDKGELSYKSEGGVLLFSPYLQALKDVESKEPPVGQKRKEDLWIEYPLQGRLSGNYYALVNILLLAFNKGYSPLVPNDFPAFSSLKVKDDSWKSSASLYLKSNDKGYEFSWKQPYGALGLMGGIELQSSGWVYFLSLLQFTKQSF